jgi:ABC-type polysaccharide/polyol phosphate export permease
MFKILSAGLADLRDGVKLAPLWAALGWRQTLARFHRTVLGPFWMSSGVLALAFALSFVFGGLLGIPWRENLPFVITGIIAWAMIGGAIAEGATAFLMGAGLMQVQKLPLSFQIFIHMYRMVINFLAQLITAWVLLICVGLFKVPHWTILPGLLLVYGNTFMISLIVAIPSTRFRDLGHMIGLGAQVAFFLSPVFWHADQMKGPRRVLLDYNPLAHQIELIRQPLLGHAAAGHDWLWGLSTLGISAVVGVIMLSLYRKRVIFWL